MRISRLIEIYEEYPPSTRLTIKAEGQPLVETTVVATILDMKTEIAKKGDNAWHNLGVIIREKTDTTPGPQNVRLEMDAWNE